MLKQNLSTPASVAGFQHPIVDKDRVQGVLDLFCSLGFSEFAFLSFVSKSEPMRFSAPESRLRAQVLNSCTSLDTPLSIALLEFRR